MGDFPQSSSGRCFGANRPVEVQILPSFTHAPSDQPSSESLNSSRIRSCLSAVSRLGKFEARRTLAKTSLEDGLRHANDFYWGILASTHFATSSGSADNFVAFVSSENEFRGQGRLRPGNLLSLVDSTDTELPKFALIVQFSYFESFLRDVCLAGILANPGLVAEPAAQVDGEEIADDEHLLSAIQALAVPAIESWLRGTYADRFARMRSVFKLPEKVTAPHVPVLDNYYAKRNCLVHRQGIIDAKAKRHFQNDTRNQVGGQVVLERSDFLALHRTIHVASDEIDGFMVQQHVKNSEILRLLYQLRREQPTWTAKDFAREFMRLKLPGLVGRNQIARVLGVREQ